MKHLHPVSLLLLLSLCLAACAHAPNTPAPPEEVALRQTMLDWAILGTRPPGIDIDFPDGHVVARYSTIVLHDDGSAANRELHLPARKVAILDSEAIRARAEDEGDFVYLRFDRVAIEGDEATVRLSLGWALTRATRESGRIPVNCGGAEVCFQQQDGVWVGKGILSTWRS